MSVTPQLAYDIGELMKLERRVFAAKVRMARALLGLSQSEFGFRVGLTQRAIHKLEQGETEPRRATVRAIEAVWAEHTIVFDDLPDGGFRVGVCAAVFDRPVTARARRESAVRSRLGITATAPRGLA